MDNTIWLSALIPILGVGVLVLFIAAIVQHNKTESRAGFKQAFFTVVAFVMLAITIGSLTALLTASAKQTVFKAAIRNRYDMPPELVFAATTAKPESVPVSSAVTCKDTCLLTADDKTQFTNWKTQYQEWQKRNNNQTQFRSTLASSLAFLIIALPLYLVFVRLMEKGSKKEQEGSSKPLPLRSLYYYFLAFSGLVILVVSGGLLLNTGLRTWLNVETASNNGMVTNISPPTASVKSVINCATQCGFTFGDVALANQWLVDQAQYQKNAMSVKAQRDSDFANELPLIFVSIPLFWYHFARIRKEARDVKPLTPSAPTS